MRAVAIHETITSRVMVSRMDVVSPSAVRARLLLRELPDHQGATSSGNARQVRATHQMSSNLPPLKPRGPDQRADEARPRSPRRRR